MVMIMMMIILLIIAMAIIAIIAIIITIIMIMIMIITITKRIIKVFGVPARADAARAGWGVGWGFCKCVSFTIGAEAAGWTTQTR